eukprot:9438368-Lingulodinium_polyedra.AAC.1
MFRCAQPDERVGQGAPCPCTAAPASSRLDRVVSRLPSILRRSTRSRSLLGAGVAGRAMGPELLGSGRRPRRCPM